jgi:hypothetical protein
MLKQIKGFGKGLFLGGGLIYYKTKDTKEAANTYRYCIAFSPASVVGVEIMLQ